MLVWPAVCKSGLQEPFVFIAFASLASGVGALLLPIFRNDAGFIVREEAKNKTLTYDV